METNIDLWVSFAAGADFFLKRRQAKNSINKIKTNASNTRELYREHWKKERLRSTRASEHLN